MQQRTVDARVDPHRARGTGGPDGEVGHAVAVRIERGERAAESLVGGRSAEQGVQDRTVGAAQDQHLAGSREAGGGVARVADGEVGDAVSIEVAQGDDRRAEQGVSGGGRNRVAERGAEGREGQRRDPGQRGQGFCGWVGQHFHGTGCLDNSFRVMEASGENAKFKTMSKLYLMVNQP